MKLILGDCLEKLKELPDNSVDTIITDPPYGLKFMGKEWDYDVPSVEIWKECLRVLKPGGYLLSFAGTRTQHRMAVNIEDAGFEIRDMIAWVYGSGFPKSLNIGKVMDKYLKTGNASWNGTGDSSNGALGYSKLQHNQGYRPADYSNKHQNKEEITEDLAKKWEGWGTALKPALEPITVARKPLGEKTVAENCLKWGVGGINIDGCRVGTDTRTYKGMSSNKPEVGTFRDDNWKPKNIEVTATGRFPANLIHDGSDEVVGLFPQTGNGNGGKPYNYAGKEYNNKGTSMFNGDKPQAPSNFNDLGSAARFFMSCKYTPKDAIMNICEDSIYVNNVGNSLPIMSLIESVVNISSVLKSATPNLDLLNHYLNVLFVEKKSESIVIDFVAKLVAISEVPEGVLNQQELTVIQDFITSCKGCSQTQNPVSSVGKWEDTDITQIIINLLRLCGYVLLATEENTNSGKREVGVVNGEPKRFLYCSKASKRERNKGLENMEKKAITNAKGNGLGRVCNICGANQLNPCNCKNNTWILPKKNQNNHPTVKPIALMEYLVKLVSREGQVVLDPFMGSGTTGMACVNTGRDFIGIEIDEDYFKIAQARIESCKESRQLTFE